MLLVGKRRVALNRAINAAAGHTHDYRTARKELMEIRVIDDLLRHQRSPVFRRLTDPNFIVSALALGISLVSFMMHMLRMHG